MLEVAQVESNSQHNIVKLSRSNFSHLERELRTLLRSKIFDLALRRLVRILRNVLIRRLYENRVTFL